jgi:regulation of enolase protein 1 (concanavalin A-like superfamily)
MKTLILARFRRSVPQLAAAALLTAAWAAPVMPALAVPIPPKPTPSKPVPALPSPWKQADIGAVGVPGTAKSVAGTWTITGAGEDIFGQADSFHFMWRKWHGDGQITARVVRYQRQDMWTKVGAMARETTAAGSKFADILVTPDRGAEFQWRAQTPGDAQTSDQVPSPTPFWVRLVRNGDTLTGYVSADGKTWQPRGHAVVTLSPDFLLGICVTSHKNDVTTEAVVDLVTVK